ncbi:hypothetical protein LFL97_19930 [Burkholderia sp. JSH-S8]|nr:hypothetical protein LFL97_19930 [Burkholderia sp. JSH-S8]
MSFHHKNAPKIHQRSTKCCPVTREHSRPMCKKRARGLSRQYHRALERLCTGHADPQALARLFMAVGTAWGIHEALRGRDTPEQPNFESGWKAMLTYLEQLRRHKPVHVSIDEAAVLKQLLILHDAQLTVTPVHELLVAHRRFARLLNLSGQSDTSTP